MSRMTHEEFEQMLRRSAAKSARETQEQIRQAVDDAFRPLSERLKAMERMVNAPESRPVPYGRSKTHQGPLRYISKSSYQYDGWN